VKFYRIETDSGQGPYRSNRIGNLCSVLEAFCQYDQTPEPRHDGIDAYQISGHRFGFKSLEDLTAWFNPVMLKVLSVWKNDDWSMYAVYVYEVDSSRVLFGHHQIMADISDLTPEEIIDIRSLIG